MQNARVMGPWRLPPKCQRKAWEKRKCEPGSISLQAGPKRAIHEAMRVKSKF
jgi:hypothetical protein